MGKVLDSELRRIQEPGKPVNVAAKVFQGRTTLTVLAPSGKGWDYSELAEIPAWVSLNQLASRGIPGASVTRASGETAGNWLFWSGVEIKVARKALPEWKAGCRVTAALLPRSMYSYVSAPLLPGYEASGEEALTGALRGLEAGALQLDELEFDPFEADSGWLVARLGDLTRLHTWSAAGGRNLGSGYAQASRSANRRPAGDLVWNFGFARENPEILAMSVYSECEWLLGTNVQLRAQVTPIAGADVGPLVDFAEGQAMGRDTGRVTPSGEEKERLLSAAVKVSLGGREEGSTYSLYETVRFHYESYYRDAVQRLELQPVEEAEKEQALGRIRLEDVKGLIGEMAAEFPGSGFLAALRREEASIRELLQGKFEVPFGETELYLEFLEKMADLGEG